MTTLTLYYRSYCGLCEEMWRALEAQRPALGFELVVVDVDADPVLERAVERLVVCIEHFEQPIAHQQHNIPRTKRSLSCLIRKIRKPSERNPFQ